MDSKINYFIISELALLYQAGFLDENGQDWTTARVNTYMTGLFDYLNNAPNPALGYPADNNRLVQQWLWYSLNVRWHNRKTQQLAK